MFTNELNRNTVEIAHIDKYAKESQNTRLYQGLLESDRSRRVHRIAISAVLSCQEFAINQICKNV